MKYYQEYIDSKKTEIWPRHILAYDPTSEVVYALLEDDQETYEPDLGTGQYYISQYCTEIPERLARVRCPLLFAYLEKEEIIRVQHP